MSTPTNAALLPSSPVAGSPVAAIEASDPTPQNPFRIVESGEARTTELDEIIELEEGP